MLGGSASCGSRPRTRSTRVRTSSAASLRFVPHAKFRRTVPDPSDAVEFICSRPGTAASVCSSGRTISSSISSGPDAAVPDAHRDARIRHVRHQVDRQPHQRDRRRAASMTAEIMNIVTGRSMARRGMLMDVYFRRLLGRPCSPLAASALRRPPTQADLSPSRSASAPTVHDALALVQRRRAFRRARASCRPGAESFEVRGRTRRRRRTRRAVPSRSTIGVTRHDQRIRAGARPSAAHARTSRA